MRATHSSVRPRAGQQGYTLVELAIAVGIGLFLVGGVLTMLQNTRTAFGTQNQHAQLQDNERLAMMMIADVIQAAGYFPNPTGNSAAFALPATAPFTSGGQAIFGTYSAAAPGDTIQVRYQTANNDGILNCSGSSNTTGGNNVYVNVFSVTAGGQLICTMNGTQYPLVGGQTVVGGQNLTVQNMTILYGVSTGATNNVDTYMNANQVAASGNWGNVTTVQVTLTFNNPLYVAANQGQPQLISFKRVIGVMNRLGVKL
jgi:type IV pilus assembly protein PilW